MTSVEAFHTPVTSITLH